MPRILVVLLSLALLTASCSGSDDESANPSESVLPADDELTQDTVLFDDEGGEDLGGEGGDDDDGETQTFEQEQPVTAPAATPSVVIYRFGVLGGWTGSDWDDRFPESADAVGAAAGDEFQVVGLDGVFGTAVAGEPTMICDPIGSFGVPTEPELAYDFDTGSASFGVRADWDALPRAATVTGGGSEVYMEQVRGLLEQNGIDPTLAAVDQVARVDLEGDGVDEVVLTANRAPDWPNPDAGNYSIVLLRKLVDEQVQTAILFNSYVREEPESFFWERAGLSGFADLNGDGKLEIIVTSQYYEGDGVQAFEYVNDDLGPVPVLGSGCGA